MNTRHYKNLIKKIQIYNQQVIRKFLINNPTLSSDRHPFIWAGLWQIPEINNYQDDPLNGIQKQRKLLICYIC